MFSEAMQSGCNWDRIWGTLHWTAGQRIDPTTVSSFVWRVMSSDRNSDTVSAMNYTNWMPGQPDNLGHYGRIENCVQLASDFSYRWNDAACLREFCFVCELDIMS